MPNSSNFTSGIVGGIAGATLLYGLYSMTPSGRVASKINKAAREADKKYQQAASTLKSKAPSTDEAIHRLKQFCYSYLAWVPGGRQYVDTAFDDFEAVRERNRDEVDKLVAETYARFQDIAKSGLSMESASKTYEALAELGRRLAKLTGRAADQILDNHPQLRDKVGEPMHQLKEMGEQYGPEAKKMVDDTWDQIGDVLSRGFSADAVTKVRQLVDDKLDKLRELRDQAWDKGLEQAKPYLDKNPRVKKLITDNKDALKQGNASALFKLVKDSVEGGDMSKLEDYVKKAADRAKSSSAGQTAMSMVGSAAGSGSGSGLGVLGPFLGVTSQGAGEKVQRNIDVLTKVVKDHSSEGAKLLDETKEELKRVLEEQAKKAQKIVESAQKA